MPRRRASSASTGSVPAEGVAVNPQRRTTGHTDCRWLRRQGSGPRPPPAPPPVRPATANAKIMFVLVRLCVSRPRSSMERHKSTNTSGWLRIRWTRCQASLRRRRASRSGRRAMTVWPSWLYRMASSMRPGFQHCDAVHVQERQPRMVDGHCRLDEFFGPGDGFIVLDPKADECRVRGDADGGIEADIVVVRRPSERRAQIGQLDAEPRRRPRVGGGCPRARGCRLRGLQSSGHARRRTSAAAPRAASCSSPNWRMVSSMEYRVRWPRPVGHQQRLPHERIQQIHDGIDVGAPVLVGTGHRTGAVEIESAGEDRTPVQECLLGIIELVVGPCHRLPQRLMPLKAVGGDPTSSRNR